MANRIELHKPYWLERFKPKEKKRIFVFLGLLNEKTQMHIREGLTKGGPLGELVQWSDILAALISLGHEVTVSTKFK